MDIGDYARACREARGWSTVQLAMKSGVHRNTIESFERGRFGTSIRNVIDMADALGVSLDEYVGRNVDGYSGKN